jgi:hypothetical protein
MARYHEHLIDRSDVLVCQMTMVSPRQLNFTVS